MNMIHRKTFLIITPLVSTSKSRKKLHHHLEDMPKGRKEEWARARAAHKPADSHSCSYCDISDVKVEGME